MVHTMKFISETESKVEKANMADCSGEEQSQGVSCGAPFSSLPRLKPYGSLPSELPPPEGGHTVAIKMRSQVIA